MKLDIYQVDAFTDHVFSGNPAAVCPVSDWPADEVMQQIAMENNLSETAFFVEKPEGFGLRWFTPKTEVDLCGHATLAAAHVLFEHLNYQKTTISFFTHSGELKVARKGGRRYAMNFPAKKLSRDSVPEPLAVAFDVEQFESCFKADDYLLVFESEQQVRDLSPDFALLAEVETRGVIVTAPGEEVDFVSRFFAPAVGIDEDPVTGSAHTMLTPYWAQRLQRRTLTARQVSARGGELKCRMLVNDRVEISGQACTFLTGEIDLTPSN